MTLFSKTTFANGSAGGTPITADELNKIGAGVEAAGLGFFSCTSATRPGAPDPGQPIYETDTNRWLLWNEDVSGWVIAFAPPAQFTPTWINVSVGNGSTSGRYSIANGLMHWSVRLSFGSTTSVSGTIGVQMPVGFTGNVTDGPNMGMWMANDDSASAMRFAGASISASTANIADRIGGPQNAGGNNGVSLGWDAASPMTWTTTDSLNGAGTALLAV